jgi:hypothetical protein
MTSIATRVGCVLCVAFVALASSARAEESLPSFPTGQWAYHRSVMVPGGRPRVTEQQKCGSPSDDVASNIATLKARRCTFTPIVRNGTRYRWSSTCPTATDIVRMQSVLIVRNEDAYEVIVEADRAGEHSRTVTAGRRLGECPTSLLKRPLPRVLAPSP